VTEHATTGKRIEGSSRVRGARIAWTSEGEGPLVVWAHGLTNDRWSMEDSGVVDWTPVVERFRLVRIDWRGHGRSSGDPDPAEYTWDALADDLLVLLDDLGAGEPARVIGCSMGTGSLVTAAVRAPGRFERIVLTAPPTAWETRAAQGTMYRQMADIVEQRGMGGLLALAEDQPATGIFAELPDQAPMEPRVSADLLPSVLRGAALADMPPRDAVKGLAAPALILSWRDDPGHPVSTGEILHELIPDSEFHVAQTIADTLAWGPMAAAFLSGSTRGPRG
jgi:3-oxoadipate enol-lactonase